MAELPTESVPKSVEPAYLAIIGLTDAICAAHLNDDYAELSRKLAAELARKRPSAINQSTISMRSEAVLR